MTCLRDQTWGLVINDLEEIWYILPLLGTNIAVFRGGNQIHTSVGYNKVTPRNEYFCREMQTISKKKYMSCLLKLQLSWEDLGVNHGFVSLLFAGEKYHWSRWPLGDLNELLDKKCSSYLKSLVHQVSCDHWILLMISQHHGKTWCGQATTHYLSHSWTQFCVYIWHH